jgi:hypothetical protein
MAGSVVVGIPGHRAGTPALKQDSRRMVNALFRLDLGITAGLHV